MLPEFGFLNPFFYFWGCNGGTNDEPWRLVAKNVMEDLLLSFQHVKSVMEESNMEEESKPSLVARFGRILFHGLVLSISHNHFYSNPFYYTTQFSCLVKQTTTSVNRWLILLWHVTLLTFLLRVRMFLLLAMSEVLLCWVD